MKAVLIWGPPAVGKSTQAKEFFRYGYCEVNRDTIRFENVAPGATWKTYRFSKENEKEVTRIWWEKIHTYAKEGKNIVISDTLCNKGRREHVIRQLEELGYKIILLELYLPVEELLWRDDARGDMSVGADVVWRMYKQQMETRERLE